MFYSNTIFKSVGDIPGSMITFYGGLVNFLATFGGLYLLFKAGRRTIMLSMNALMSAILIMVGICSLQQWNIPSVILVLSFIAAFEFSSGPITWLYMAEIMQDKSVSVATVLNWLINLLISAITPSLVAKIGDDNIGWIFITAGGMTIVGTIFIYTFMLETRGKSPQQIEAMFSVDKEYSKLEVNKKLVQDDYSGI